jgi:hypothetical protein
MSNFTQTQQSYQAALVGPYTNNLRYKSRGRNFRNSKTDAEPTQKTG